MVVLEGGRSQKGGYQNWTSANKGAGGWGAKFWSFWENVIIDDPFSLVWLTEETLDSLISRRSQSHWLKCCSVELKTAL